MSITQFKKIINLIISLFDECHIVKFAYRNFNSFAVFKVICVIWCVLATTPKPRIRHDARNVNRFKTYVNKCDMVRKHHVMAKNNGNGTPIFTAVDICDISC